MPIDFSGNPYFQSARDAMTPEQRRDRDIRALATMLANLGTGISTATARGRPWYAGIAPAALMTSRAIDTIDANNVSMRAGDGAQTPRTAQDRPPQQAIRIDLSGRRQ